MAARPTRYSKVRVSGCERLPPLVIASARPWGRVTLRVTVGLALGLCAAQGYGQNFVYVEAGLAACPAAPAPSSAEPKPVAPGAAVPGSIRVSCGFDQGSYTVTLAATDPGATISPKSFIVNFGRVVGNGVFSVKFATSGVQSLSASITTNMGSPPVQGRFVSAVSEFKVAAP